jgi:hypothetical protein
MTGAYLRVKRNGKYENVEVEHLTDKEREDLLKDDNRLIQWLNCVCNKLSEAEKILDDLVEDGILQHV